MPTTKGSKLLALRIVVSFLFITGVVSFLFLSEGREKEFMEFLRIFIPFSGLLLGTFLITNIILEGRVNYHLKMLISGITSYAMTVGVLVIIRGINWDDIAFGILWILMVGAISFLTKEKD